MSSPLAFALIALLSLCVVAWLGLLFHPAQAWRLRPVAEDEPRANQRATWPSVCVLIPAHNEAHVLDETLAAILEQRYAGEWHVVVVDERSSDETGEIARRAAAGPNAARLTLVRGASLPKGWIGKVWGLEQARNAAARRAPAYYLLTDADIIHAPASLETLVAESEEGKLALNSRMARLRCVSRAEKALIPAFVFFFNLLYPMRRANDANDPLAAAAGGCVLVRADTLRDIGGFERIRNELIDDISLAEAVKRTDSRIRLALARSDVRSVRRYETIGPIWRMVRRTAFNELGYSWPKLAGTVFGLLLLFVLPVAGVVLSAVLAAGRASVAGPQLAALGALSVAALVLMRIAYQPAVTFFELRRGWAWTLPFAGAAYGAITLDSARSHIRHRSREW